MIEFSSPNTNKPLHLGHVRNILLGDSISKIFQEVGNKVHKTQIINDRGIHICKSMVAWNRFGNNSNPKNENTKGDVFANFKSYNTNKTRKDSIKRRRYRIMTDKSNKFTHKGKLEEWKRAR